MRGFFACTAQKGDTEILFLAARRPGSGRPRHRRRSRCIFRHCGQDGNSSSARLRQKAVYTADAHAAADAAAGIELRVPSCPLTPKSCMRILSQSLGQPVRATLTCRSFGKIAFSIRFARPSHRCCQRADAVADAGHDISGTGRFKTSASFALIDVEFIDDRLESLLYFFNFFKGNPHDFKALTDGQMDFAITVRFGNMLDLAQDLGIQGTAGYTYTG